MVRYASVQALESQIGRPLIQQGSRLVDAARGRHVPSAEAEPGCGQADKASAREVAPRGMNKTERRYRDEILQPALQAGALRRFEFEALKLLLGHRLSYKPDFYVVTAEGRIEIREVKGAYIYEDGLMKFKMAAAMFPEWDWQLWQWKEQKWSLILKL